MLDFDWLADLPPFWARAMVIGFFLAALVFALTRRRSDIFEGVERPRWYMNLKLWVLVLVVIQVGLYCYFR